MLICFAYRIVPRDIKSLVQGGEWVNLGTLQTGTVGNHGDITKHSRKQNTTQRSLIMERQLESKRAAANPVRETFNIGGGLTESINVRTTQEQALGHLGIRLFGLIVIVIVEAIARAHRLLTHVLHFRFDALDIGLRRSKNQEALIGGRRHHHIKSRFQRPNSTASFANDLCL